ncbi:Alpha/Beta hydrolase protein [Aspergillus pseudoustus]|uniref:Pheromone-processing carboxypeptidase KEX1 n=1 Tax=Aspergillus pseudoustus TaxID=1810923 RepID=A0ABR4KKP3_9EURO
MHSLFSSLWTISCLLFFSLTHAAPDISRFKVVSLPGNPALPPSWAGRLPVPNTEEGNALFFWLFQTEDPAYDDNLLIWFNGGPGCSSLIGLTTGNGPVSFEGNSTRAMANPYSWSKYGHLLYIDQPVGTGYSTASYPYPAVDNDVVTSHFYDWLQSFFDHFPHLRSKQVHMMGESWAGIYVPYFASAIVNNQGSFPLDLRSITLGDASIGNPAAMSSVTIGKFLKTHQSLLQIPDEVLEVYRDAGEACGFEEILEEAAQFPPASPFHIPGNPEDLNYKHRRQQSQRRDLNNIANGSCNIGPTTPEEVRSSIMHSSCHGRCATFATTMDYLSTASASGAGKPCFDVYDISHDCSTVNSLSLVSSYFSRADVQTALNIPNIPREPTPTSAADVESISSSPSEYAACNSTILGTLLGSQSPRAPVYSILPTLVTSHNISLHLYFGEYDMLLNHYGAELVLQNMTWHGAQGFSQPINRPFYSDNAAPFLPRHPPGGNSSNRNSTSTTSLTNPHTQDNHNNASSSQHKPPRPGTSNVKPRIGKACPVPEAGKWASERGVTYHLFWGAGHSVFTSKPREMFAYVRDVVVAD